MFHNTQMLYSSYPNYKSAIIYPATLSKIEISRLMAIFKNSKSDKPNFDQIYYLD